MDRRDPGPRVAAHQREGVGIAKIGYPIGVRRLTVRRRAVMAPRIVRVTLAGPELAGFPSFQADDHIKIVFPEPDGTRRDPTPRADEPLLDWPRPLPRTRTYTVRRVDPHRSELDLDVVLHGAADSPAEGIGARWGRTVAVGDDVTIAGPPGAAAFPHHRGHHVFAVDETALPFVGRWLDESPPDVRADVVVETGDPSDHDYPLAPREGVVVHRSVRDGERSQLAATVAGLGRPDAFLYAAGEAEAIRPLRRAVTEGPTSGVRVVGYWKRGVADLDDD